MNPKPLLALLLALCACAHARPDAAPVDLSRHLEGRSGTFVLLDLQTGRVARHDPARAARRFSPCSTFKVPHALIALETGVHPGADSGLKWSGEPQFLDAWNRDHTLQSAITHSVVWYFQRTAERIGEARMQTWLDRLGYGNADLSSGLTRFWLHGSLTISADEQVAFLERLYRDRLPVSARAMRLTRKLIELERGDGAVFSGKTGTHFESGRPVLGWFVGHLATASGEYVFAMNVDGIAGAQVRTLCEAALGELGLRPAGEGR